MPDETEIERVARRICAELGFDPDERVGHGELAVMTDFERSKVSVVHDVLTYSPRWRLYRDKAALALAMAKAVQP